MFGPASATPLIIIGLLHQSVREGFIIKDVATIPEAKPGVRALTSHRNTPGPGYDAAQDIHYRSIGNNSLCLQRSLGGASGEEFHATGSPRAIRQSRTTLAVNKPGDRYEQEADRAADQVMRMPGDALSPSLSLSVGAIPSVQRACDACSEAREEEMVQAKESPGETPYITPNLQRQIDSLRGGGEPLPMRARAFFEPRFNHDFSEVRVHTGAGASESARGVNALAYTVGRDVVFGTGQYAPETDQGRMLIAHELAHVVQQSRGGASKPSPLPSSGLEDSARQASVAVARGESVRVAGACAPGLARQERWLSEQPNPSVMSDAELANEVRLIRQWLHEHPSDGADAQRLTEVLSLFENEMINRQQAQQPAAPPAAAPPAASPAAAPVAPGASNTAAPPLAAGAIAVPLTGLGTPAVSGPAATGTATRVVGAGLSAPLAAVAAFFAVLLYSSSSIMSGEEEMRLLEAARRRPAPGGATGSPPNPDLSQALGLLRTAITTISAATAMAMTAAEIERHRGRIQDVLNQIEEVIRTNPRLGMMCSAQLIAFRTATRAALDALAQPPDQINKFALIRLIQAVETALTALLACLGLG